MSPRAYTTPVTLVTQADAEAIRAAGERVRRAARDYDRLPKYADETFARRQLAITMNEYFAITEEAFGRSGLVSAEDGVGQ